MSAGIFELYKMALMSHFEAVMKKEDLPRVEQIKSVKDKKGRIVESQVKVNQRKTNKGLGLHKYTVNLYHTRSSLMVNGNGREAGTFTNAHTAALGHIINIQNLDSYDDEIHSILVRELVKIQLDPISPTSQERSVKEKVQNLEALSQGSGAITQLRDKSPNVSQQFLCLHCDQSAQMNVIECSFVQTDSTSIVRAYLKRNSIRMMLILIETTPALAVECRTRLLRWLQKRRMNIYS